MPRPRHARVGIRRDDRPHDADDARPPRELRDERRHGPVPPGHGEGVPGEVRRPSQEPERARPPLPPLRPARDLGPRRHRLAQRMGTRHRRPPEPVRRAQGQHVVEDRPPSQHPAALQVALRERERLGPPAGPRGTPPLRHVRAREGHDQQADVVRAHGDGEDAAQDGEARDRAGGRAGVVQDGGALREPGEAHAERRTARAAADVQAAAVAADQATDEHRGQSLERNDQGQPRPAIRVPPPARVPQAQVHQAREDHRQAAPRGRRGGGRQGRRGQEQEGLRRRPRPRPQEGPVRLVHPPPRLQQPVPVADPGVQPLLHDDGLGEGQGHRRRGGRAGEPAAVPAGREFGPRRAAPRH
mmetsp:Transcript_16776/g.38953  ORF Transcript_16776/g.38953 Transcript_16776/m.38953 type:complete len:357 (+) Transcript_16776:856-1926(+)